MSIELVQKMQTVSKMEKVVAGLTGISWLLQEKTELHFYYLAFCLVVVAIGFWPKKRVDEISEDEFNSQLNFTIGWYLTVVVLCILYYAVGLYHTGKWVPTPAKAAVQLVEGTKPEGERSKTPEASSAPTQGKPANLPPPPPQEPRSGAPKAGSAPTQVTPTKAAPRPPVIPTSPPKFREDTERPGIIP